MPKILFRADAQKSIGTGDLMSLIYLSRVFRGNGWKCFFAIRDYKPALRIVKKQNLKNVYLINSRKSINYELSLIKKICISKKIDCLFIEGNRKFYQEYRNLRKPVPVKAGIAIDEARITNDFDIVVNWCVPSSSQLYEDFKNTDIKFILGFENTILPDYFDWQKISSNISQKKDVKNILISISGADEFDLSKKVVRALSKTKDEYKIKVITGPGYEKQAELSRFMRSKFKNFSLKQNLSNLFHDYLWADIAFSSGGLISSELVASKVPAILIASYEHQIKRCEYYAAKKWAHYAGYRSQIDDQAIIISLNYMKKNINLFRGILRNLDFKGANEKIFKSVDSCRQSKFLV